jgi:hypothetical protein
MRRSISILVLLTPVALAACQTLAPLAASGARYTLTVQPPAAFTQRGLASLGDVRAGAYTRADIDHLDVELDTVNAAGAETLVLTRTVLQTQLGKDLTFEGLAPSQAYRIYAKAYRSAGSTKLISTRDSRSYLDIAAGSDDTPLSAASVTTLKVGLLDRPALVLSVIPTAPSFGASAMVCDSTGKLYVARADLPEILSIAPDGTSSILAGGVTQGTLDGPAQDGQFKSIGGLVMTGDSILYATDVTSSTVRKIDFTGPPTVSTIAGVAGTSAVLDGNGTTVPPLATFMQPNGLAIDSTSHLLIADPGSQTIRSLNLAGVNFPVTTVAGVVGAAAPNDGAALTAGFLSPWALANSPTGSLAIADVATGLRVLNNGTISTLIGHGTSDVDGPDTTAKLTDTRALAYDALGNLYIGDAANLRRRDVLGQVSTLLPRKATDGTNQAVVGASCLAVAPDGTIYASVGTSIYVIK